MSLLYPQTHPTWLNRVKDMLSNEYLYDILIMYLAYLQGRTCFRDVHLLLAAVWKFSIQEVQCDRLSEVNDLHKSIRKQIIIMRMEMNMSLKIEGKKKTRE